MRCDATFILGKSVGQYITEYFCDRDDFALFVD